MKSRLWLNIALVIIIAVLVALVYFKPGIQKPKPPPTLTKLEAAAIDSIKIERTGMPAAQLVRSRDGWQMTAPLKLQADQYLVKSLLDGLQATVSSGFEAKPSELSQYGLNPPQVRLWLNHTEFDFGATEPIHNNRYVKTDGEIRLTGNLLYYQVDHPPLWWANKRLLPDAAHIIGLQLPNATLTLKGAKWQLAPANPAISSDAIQTLVDNWKNAAALSTAKIGNGRPQGEVAIELARSSTPLRFAILADPDYLILARPDLGLEYQLDSGQRSALLELESSTKPSTAVKKPAQSSSNQPTPKSNP